MNMIQIKNGKIEKYKLPSTGTLEYEHPEHGFEKGQTVSGYNNLPHEVLLKEGWLPLIDNKPNYNIDTQYIIPVGYDILFDRVERIYEVKELADLPVSQEKKMASLFSAMQKVVRIDSLTEEELLEVIYIYPEYETDKAYKVGDVFRYKNELFEVVQARTSQADWTPSELPALYKSYMHKDIIPEWVQPLGAHDAYKLDDKVIYGGKVYINVVDNNVWKPGEYGWDVYI